MSREVHVTDAAEAHMAEAAVWWAKHHSLKQALRWLDEIHLAITTLSDRAERRPLARESSKFPYDVHELSFGTGRRRTHRILYRIVGKRVEIMAVRHSAQDQVEPGDL